MKRIISLILASILLLGLLPGCSNEEAPKTGSSEGSGKTDAAPAPADGEVPPDEQGGEMPQEEEPSPLDRYKVPDDLPDDLDFGGAPVRMLHRDWQLTTWEVYVEEDSGDPLYSAIYHRNLKLEDRLNVKITPVVTSDQQSTLRQAAAAQSDDFDICGGYRYFAMPMAVEGIIRNLYDIDYVNTDKPWWAQSFLDAATIDDKRFFLTGDGALSMLWTMGAMFVNNTLYDRYIGKIEDLWQTVTDGKWTFDLLGEYAEKVYTDVNGNGARDKGDVFGFASETYSAIDFLVTAADVRWSEKDADGVPQLIINNDHTVSFVEKLYSLLYENKGTYAATLDNGRMGEGASSFAGDELMFTFGYASAAGDFREMESDYSIIPLPKFDEEQEAYKTYVHDAMTVFCVPVTNQNNWEMTGAFLEALFSESYRTVTDAYYETLLKQKFARNPITADMLDLIKESVAFDFVVVNSGALNDCVHIFWDLMTEGKTDFSSRYAAMQKSLNGSLQTLVKKYKKSKT